MAWTYRGRGSGVVGDSGQQAALGATQVEAAARAESVACRGVVVLAGHAPPPELAQLGTEAWAGDVVVDGAAPVHRGHLSRGCQRVPQAPGCQLLLAPATPIRRAHNAWRHSFSQHHARDSAPAKDLGGRADVRQALGNVQPYPKRRNGLHAAETVPRGACSDPTQHAPEHYELQRTVAHDPQ